jgi:hypothetical protein
MTTTASPAEGVAAADAVRIAGLIDEHRVHGSLYTGRRPQKPNLRPWRKDARSSGESPKTFRRP